MNEAADDKAADDKARKAAFWRAFSEQHADYLNRAEEPFVGEVVVWDNPKGQQEYRCIGFDGWQRKNGAAMRMAVWASNCRGCGARFYTAALGTMNPAVVHCEQHRRGKGLQRAGAEADAVQKPSRKAKRWAKRKSDQPRGVRCKQVWVVIKAECEKSGQEFALREAVKAQVHGRIADIDHSATAFKNCVKALESQGFIRQDGNALWVVKGLSDASNS